jgi:hypothetical protein
VTKRIVFVHGINNQDNSAAKIESEWWQAMVDGWTSAGLSIHAKPEIDAAFYGDILAKGAKGSDDFIAQGNGTTAASTAAFDFLAAYRDHLGMSAQELTAAMLADNPDMDAVAHGPLLAGVVRLAKAIANRLPANGKVLAGAFLEQAVVYIDNAALRLNIHKAVNEQVFQNKPDPTVVVSHSLGTVVAYNVLLTPMFGNQGRTLPLYMTLGSPLGIDMMRRVLPARSTFPDPPINSWFNGRRADDFVALDTSLKSSTIGFDGIDNQKTRMVDGVDPHSIAGYLKDPKVARVLHNALA